MIKGFAGGLVGVALALVLWHLWIDHTALHSIIDLINRQVAAQPKVEAPK